MFKKDVEKFLNFEHKNLHSFKTRFYIQNSKKKSYLEETSQKHLLLIILKHF